ncbi:unnamed protein product [Symbiodinium natans]|uniref:Tyrosine-protein kinase ephrin type A/B receptor-like domain-containing protein n=1 Tax=Symbiodinium natans TaxID=878477 RepID=A0A812L5P3_9DINO|nr:unnamed protein product [Symbiodinium natans]
MRPLAGLVSCAVAIVQAVVAEDALSSLVQRKRAGGDFERCTGHSLGLDPIESNVSLSDGTWSWCSGGEGTPIWPSSAGGGKVCCPATASWCSGCAEATEQGDGCAACLGGYVLQEGTCQPCMDLPHWSDASGANCFAVPRSQCSDARFRGLSSNKACCKCGGGLRSAAPFRYFVLPLVSGGGVKGHPLPRTGSSYSLDAGCQLLPLGDKS